MIMYEHLNNLAIFANRCSRLINEHLNNLYVNNNNIIEHLNINEHLNNYS